MKNIIFCADGTWNGPYMDENKDGLPDVTNVFKFFFSVNGEDTLQTLNLKNEQEKEDSIPGNEQVAKYINGVGDSSNPLVKALGGAFGAGVIARIIRGYTYVSRHYSPGDVIFLLGFSRGAYTVRALAGFIAATGLLNPATVVVADREKAYQAAVAAWLAYRRKQAGYAIVDAVADWLPAIFGRHDKGSTLGEGTVPIRAVGVWDTVGALGIPIYAGKDKRIDTFKFADCSLSPVVKHGFHAIAIDEQRVDFAPTFWEPDPARIIQRLFPGAHADVGGGYPGVEQESDLSNIALGWMLGKMESCGVHLKPNCRAALALDPANPLGPAHTPWEDFPWRTFPKKSREFVGISGLELDDSVKSRLGKSVKATPTGSPAPYGPENIAAHLSSLGA